MQIQRRVPDVHVAEEQLYRAQVRATFEEMGREEWRIRWGLTRRRKPARVAAVTTASQSTRFVIGLSARQLCTMPGNSHVCGRIHR